MSRNLQIVLSLLLSVFFSGAFAQDKKGASNKTIMLILGSDDKKTLEERVDVGFELYKSAIAFDYIIVSGGCAAHKSNICEASEMAALLEKKGVPANIIFKEEKSMTTVQNYCYSRLLRKNDGSKVINPGDSLYVVSNHWHAIPVAARFTMHDSVHATYHIAGSILPKNTDKVNYANIYAADVSSEDFCNSGLWPRIDASYSLKSGQVFYSAIGDLVYKAGAEGVASGQPEVVSKAIPSLPAGWGEGIDAAFYHDGENKAYFLKGSNYLRFSPNGKSMDAGYPKPLSNMVKDLPANWQVGSIDAAFFNPTTKKVFLFKGDEYLEFSARNGKITKGFPKQIKTFVSNWPFGWSSGSIDAAHFNRAENVLYLYRGKEYLKASLDGRAEVQSGYPKTIKLDWPKDILGER